MQYFQISGDFHDFPQDRTMMLKDFLDDDIRSTAQDREKIEPLQWRNQKRGRIICRTQRSMNIIPLIIKKDAPPWPSGTIALTATMSSTPHRGQMFIIGVDTPRVGVSTILVQNGQQHEEVKMGPEKSPLLPTSDSDRAQTTRDFIRGQPSLQKKARLLQSNHVAAHARKKLPPDKRRSRRKFPEKNQVSLHLQLHQHEIQASRKWSPYFFEPCKIGDHIGALTWRSDPPDQNYN
ncbi:hypothetical protein BHE74_00030403 [Ensete ventricosum]|nr:hypothetical protein BHE74_00030403 [Ensete ventricosum]